MKELLGKRIKELRKSKGFTQDYLAENLKIDTRQLSKLENGKNYPSFETILGLLKMFNITFEELISVEHLKNDEMIRENLITTIQNSNHNKLKDIYKLVKAII